MKERILILVLLILATASNNIKATCFAQSCSCETDNDCINKGSGPRRCSKNAICDYNNSYCTDKDDKGAKFYCITE